VGVARRWGRRAPGRHAAPSAIPFRPAVAGAALGTAALSAVIFFASHAGADGVAVGPASAQGAEATAIPSSRIVATVEPAHFDGANALRALAESAAAREAAALAELEAAPDAGTVAVGTVDRAQILSSGFVKPVAGTPSSPFGLRFHPILHVWKLHTGTDLAAPCGTPVKAAKAGRVTFAGATPAYGNRVVVDHGGGLVTTYNHLTSYAARVGLDVQQAQIIGFVGSTGFSTGCHLHFEVLVGGAFVDPAPYLDIAPAPTVVIPPAVAPRSDTGLATATTTTTTTTPPVTTTTAVAPTSTVTTVPTTVTSTATVTTTPSTSSTAPTSTAPAPTSADPTTTSGAPPTTTTAP